jgi:hypothetical protein
MYNYAEIPEGIDKNTKRKLEAYNKALEKALSGKELSKTERNAIKDISVAYGKEFGLFKETETPAANTTNNANTSNTSVSNTATNTNKTEPVANNNTAGKIGSTAVNTVPVVEQPVLTGAEKELQTSEQEANFAADKLNTEEIQEQKTNDASSAVKTEAAKAENINPYVEENIPTWFWKEAREMAGNDDKKYGYIIANHILNTLGTGLSNIGARVQNAGGSGGATLSEYNNSMINKYRTTKLNQALENRKIKYQNLLDSQINMLKQIGIEEAEARKVQNRIRNSEFYNKYNRLNNEQQVYIMSLLTADASGAISDAALGKLIDRLMEGESVTPSEAATTVLVGEGIENFDKIEQAGNNIFSKIKGYATNFGNAWNDVFGN